MARYSGPVCRICRREGEKLYLKGERCLTPKCAFERKGFIPGMHGRTRRGKLSEYGIQLREKQKIRRMYGLLEAQFHAFYEKALAMPGITASNLMVLLESRLDNIVYRMGFASSRAAARQLVRHGHFSVNGKRVDIPSYRLSTNDIIRVSENERSRKLPAIHEAMKRVNVSRLPTYVSLDKAKMEGTFTKPERTDIPETMKLREQMVVELYSK